LAADHTHQDMDCVSYSSMDLHNMVSVHMMEIFRRATIIAIIVFVFLWALAKCSGLI
jgi:hypothetical protein